MSSKGKLKDIRTALVTGGTRGIGKAIAERFLKDGIRVIVTGKSENAEYPEGSEYRKVDFLDDCSFIEFCDFIIKKDIDILVNNAGINKIGEVTKIDLPDFDDVMKVNLRAPFRLSQLLIPKMKSNKWGRIINVSSIFGKISKEFRAPYSASKFAIDGMTAAISSEVSQHGILVNSIAPGFIDTDMTRQILGKEKMEEMASSIPMKRLGHVDEIAELVSWLVSDKNTYITSQNISIDGGFTRV